jgi:hypothetical protein
MQMICFLGEIRFDMISILPDAFTHGCLTEEQETKKFHNMLKKSNTKFSLIDTKVYQIRPTGISPT